MEVSPQDLTDYEAIRHHLPDIKPKQVKWIKELIEMLRLLGWVREPVADNLFKYLEDVTYRDIKLRSLAQMKSSAARELKRRTKPTDYEKTGQISLFHPEAFVNEGGTE